MATPKQPSLPYTQAQWAAYKKAEKKKHGADLSTSIDFGPKLKAIEALFNKIPWATLESATGAQIDQLCERHLTPLIDKVKALADQAKNEAVIPDDIKKGILPAFHAELLRYAGGIKAYCAKLDADIQRELDQVNPAKLKRLADEIPKLEAVIAQIDKDRHEFLCDKNLAGLTTGIKNRLAQVTRLRDQIQGVLHTYQGAIRHLAKRITTANDDQKRHFDSLSALHKKLSKELERLNSLLMALSVKLASDTAEVFKESLNVEKAADLAAGRMEELDKSIAYATKELASIKKDGKFISGKFKTLRKPDLEKLLARFTDRLLALESRMVAIGQSAGRVALYLKGLKHLQQEAFFKATETRLRQINDVWGVMNADIKAEKTLATKILKLNIKDIAAQDYMQGSTYGTIPSA